MATGTPFARAVSRNAATWMPPPGQPGVSTDGAWGVKEPTGTGYSPSFSKVSRGRQEEAALFTGKGAKAIALVERQRAFVLGIDNDGIDRKRRARPDDTADGVEQQGFAKALPLPFTINGEAAEDRGWHGVMWQPFR